MPKSCFLKQIMVSNIYPGPFVFTWLNLGLLIGPGALDWTQPFGGYLFLFMLAVLGFELTLMKTFYHLIHIHLPFWLFFFFIGPPAFAQSSLRSPSSYLCLPGSWDYSCETPQQVCFLRQGLINFLARAGLKPKFSYFCLPNSWG
jgi:hypothetical protein